MKIRTLRESDVAPLLDIYNYYVRTSTATFETVELTYEQMYSRLFTPAAKFPCLVAESDDGEVMGYCALHPWRPRFDYVAEATMYLAPDAVSKGLGSEMLARIIAEGKALGSLNGIIACVNANNTASRRLVERAGFKQVGIYTKVAQKFGQWLDDVDYKLDF